MLANGNGAAHLWAVLGLRIVKRVEALPVHRVAARLVPALLVDVPVPVALVRVAPAVEAFAVDDHAVVVDDHLAAVVVLECAAAA